MSENFYEVLDVPRTASQGEILDAYLTNLRKAHPDVRVSRDHHQVRDRYEAFAVLSDSAERGKYDAALAGAELCPWCGQLLAAYGLELHVADHVVKNANDGCIVCGRLPSRQFKFRANSGRVVWRKVDIVEGYLCKTCATGVYRGMQTENLIKGPWSIISILTTPYDLVRNWLAHRRVRSMPGPRPHDQTYDRGKGLGTPVLRTARVWASLVAVSVLLVIAVVALTSDGPSAPVADDGPEPATSTTVDPHDGWVVGGCARFDATGRVFPMTCGDHFATVVALVPTASECPETTDFSVSLTEDVACFEQA